MTWLITGGAGYIGSHVVRAALGAGHNIVVLDDLSTGIANRLPNRVPVEQVDLTDKQLVDQVFKAHRITGVVHLAAKKQVGESVARPEYYWEQNVGGLVNLLDAMATHHVENLVFSSSASVYGEPDTVELIDEHTECLPINPYGATKLMGEWLVQAHSVAHGTSAISLRYFNVAGAGAAHLADVFELNLIPIVIGAIRRGESPQVFGDDYPTVDGTCIRDYVHVQDLADAHVAAMAFVAEQGPGFETVNIGTGNGSSVREVLAQIARTSRVDFLAEVTQRRPGDPAQLVAAVNRAVELLGWRASRGLEQIVASAWAAEQP